jgi:8-hydroxy-5-deazaflavin:NADPH oxidoreductase
MEIGIAGAGNIGATLVRKLADGHEVKFANSKEPGTIGDLARDRGATAVSKEDAVQGVSAIVLFRFARYLDVASLSNDAPADVVVIDTSNYYPFRDGAIAEVDGRKPESVRVSEQSSRPLLKPWNALLAVTLADRGQPKGGRIAIAVAGDDPKPRPPLLSNCWRQPASTCWTLEVSITPGVSSPAPWPMARN